MSTHSPQKRPRLSLQIKALSSGPSIRTSRTLAAVINPSSPTSFNTLSNVYSTAIDRSMPSDSSRKRLAALPRLQVPDPAAVAAADAAAAATAAPAADRRSHTPYITTQLPETPLTAQPLSPSQSGAAAIHFPSAALLTSTPPLSAGPTDPGTSGAHPVFCFSPDATTDRFDGMPSMLVASGANDDGRYTRSSSTSSSTSSGSADGPVQPDGAAPALLASPPLVTSKPSRRIANLLRSLPPPYKHPRSLRSILRNSPLPPPLSKSPVSPRRQSQRLTDRASRHVMYHSPLTQTITTNTYTRSHIDLLCEDTSPASATQSPVSQSPSSPAAPAPFEDVRRRVAGLGTASNASSPVTSAPPSPNGGGGIRKRRSSSRRDRKRRWVWTLGQDDDDESEEHLSGAMAALRAAQAAEAKRIEEARREAKKETADVEMQDSVLADIMAQPSNPQICESTAIPHPLDVDIPTSTVVQNEVHPVQP